MFKDEQSEQKIYADLDDSVIRATLRPQDLIPAFLDVIWDTPEYAQLMMQPITPEYLKEIGDDHPYWDSWDCSYFLNEELFDILNSYAPDGYYFGANEGDMSDFGYWKIAEDWKVRCNNCYSIYDEDDLETMEDDGGYFKGCAVCKTDGYLMDVYEPDVVTPLINEL